MIAGRTMPVKGRYSAVRDAVLAEAIAMQKAGEKIVAAEIARRLGMKLSRGRNDHVNQQMRRLKWMGYLSMSGSKRGAVWRVEMDADGKLIGLHYQKGAA